MCVSDTIVYIYSELLSAKRHCESVSLFRLQLVQTLLVVQRVWVCVYVRAFVYVRARMLLDSRSGRRGLLGGRNCGDQLHGPRNITVSLTWEPSSKHFSHSHHPHPHPSLTPFCLLSNVLFCWYLGFKTARVNPVRCSCFVLYPDRVDGCDG